MLLSMSASQMQNLTSVLRLEETVHALVIHNLLFLQMLVFLLSVIFINVGRALHVSLVVLCLHLCRALEERSLAEFCPRIRHAELLLDHSWCTRLR